MKLTYDPEANIAYIRFRQKPLKVKTIVVSDELNIDIGQDGRIYGIELMNAQEQLLGDKLKKLVIENGDSGGIAELAIAG